MPRIRAPAQPDRRDPERVVFLSYHKVNRALADELVRHLRRTLRAPLEKTQLASLEAQQPFIEVWYDDNLNGGDRWDPLIHEKIAQADVILFLVTESSLAATYMWSEELPAAIERMGEGARVIPLLHGGVSAPILVHPRTRGCHRLPEASADRLGERKWMTQVAAGVRKAVQNSLMQLPAPVGPLRAALGRAVRELDTTQKIFDAAPATMFGLVPAPEIYRCFGGLEGALSLSDPRQLLRSLEVWRRRAATFRVKLAVALPQHAKALIEVLHAIEEVQAWAAEESVGRIHAPQETATLVRAQVELEVTEAKARLAETDKSLSDLAHAEQAPTDLEANARTHFVVQGGKHVELAQLLLQEENTDSAAVVGEVDALAREHVAYDAVVEALGGSASEVAHSTRVPLSIGIEGAVTSVQMLYDRVLQDVAEEAGLSGAPATGTTPIERKVSTGWEDLDRLTGGFRRGDLIVLGGRPSMGKSSMALEFALNVAYPGRDDPTRDVDPGIEGQTVSYFSLEMSAEQLATRMLAGMADIDGYRVRTGRIQKKEFERLSDQAANMRRMPFHIDESSGLPLAKIRSRAMRLRDQVGRLDLVVVDYFQIIPGRDDRAKCDGLKALASELDAPILLVSQLSRSLERRHDKRPQLKDLGPVLSQRADMVLMIYRERYYLEREEPRLGTEEHLAWMRRMDEVHHLAELSILKNTHVGTGRLELRFDASVTRFFPSQL